MSLQVLDQFPFAFYGAYFTAVLASDQKLYVPVEDICRTLGLQTEEQMQYLQHDRVLADSLASLFLTWSYGDSTVEDREMECLRLDCLPYWLGTIPPGRIPHESLRAKIVAFQRRLAEVAWAALGRDILPQKLPAD